MKPLYIGWILFLIPIPAKTQHFLRDAIELKPYFKSPTYISEDKRILIKSDSTSKGKIGVYLSDYFEKDSWQDIETAFGDNPFMQIESGPQSIQEIKSNPLFNLPSPLANTPGASVTSLVDGLARFLVDRTKEELAASFFRDFKNQLDSVRLFQDLFPATYQQVQTLDEDIYTYRLYIAGLRQAFLADLYVLPGNVETYLKEQGSLSGEKRLAVDFLYTAQALIDKEPAEEVFRYLSSPDAAIQQVDRSDSLYFDLAVGLRMLNLISESLRKPVTATDSTGWYSPHEIEQYLKDDIVRAIYFGLLWQKADQATYSFSDGTALRSLFESTLSSIDVLHAWQKSFTALSQASRNIQPKAKIAAAAKDSTFDAYYQYADAFIKIFEAFSRTQALIPDSKGALFKPEFISLLQQSNHFIYHLRKRNFQAAIANMIFILDKASPGEKSETMRALLKHANFMASLVAAQTPEEVEEVIGVYALPRGSSLLKREPNKVTVALNAYSGLGGGLEVLENSSDRKGIVAVSAPVGLSIEWGCKNASSWGFFLPLIDIGAVTAFRFGDPDTKDLPTLGWENIFSPGLYVIKGFKGWPVSVGLGGQVGPNLRKINAGGSGVEEASGFRFGAFASVDIPITYFHAGTKKKKKK